MERPPVSMVLVVVLSLIATLSWHTMVQADGSSAPDDTPTTTDMTREGQDNQRSPLQRRQDLLDNRITERDTRLNELNTQLNGLNTQQNEVSTRLNRMDSRLDRIETAISDMKGFLQLQKEAMDKKVESVLTDIKPRQDGTIRKKSKVYGGCQEALAHGVTCSGIYTITDCDISTRDVYCEQRLDGGGWTVIQARHNGSVDFYQDWATYKTGFGDLRGEFWLGNENIHHLTKYNDQQLKIELKSRDGEVKYADYSHFSIGDASQGYKLSISGFSGGSPPGDSMAYSNGAQFSTKDQDRDTWGIGSCATSRAGGWWYTSCTLSNLNGQYGSTKDSKMMSWYYWKGSSVSMKATRMLVRKRA